MHVITIEIALDCRSDAKARRVARKLWDDIEERIVESIGSQRIGWSCDLSVVRRLPVGEE